MEKITQNNIEIEVRSIVSDLQIRQKEDGKKGRTITGYAAKFDTWSEPIYGWFKEQIARGAFDKTDMSDVIMVFNHDISSVLARTTSGTLTLSGLYSHFDHFTVGNGSKLRVDGGAQVVSRTECNLSANGNALEVADGSLVRD